MVAVTDVVFYSISTKDAFAVWPVECQNELKLQTLEKYSWFYERLLRIEELLTTNKTNKHEI